MSESPILTDVFIYGYRPRGNAKLSSALFALELRVSCLTRSGPGAEEDFQFTRSKSTALSTTIN